MFQSCKLKKIIESAKKRTFFISNQFKSLRFILKEKKVHTY